jgi:DNA-binding protein H-NS
MVGNSIIVYIKKIKKQNGCLNKTFREGKQMADQIKKDLIKLLKAQEEMFELMIKDNITVQEMLRRNRNALIELER